ncbi:MAG: DNA mismatch repair endonuclease MutL [Verrucomicrobiota bacterium]|nr:MAG: DNA mismatch repair endonuclease MutL [Verrucomicrobiota bacterium]
MATIHLLPELIVNQIAAGEVIERPASIVKELVENSLDAGATRIVIRFEKGGELLVSVEDNGIGMSPEDAECCFQRNATSKLSLIQDLESLATFGFRGEAMASIASVGRVRMQTNDGHQGTEIRYDSGQKISVKPCSCPRGTTIEVRNLFEKIPARKRFLKSEATEAMRIIKLVRAFVLAEPEVVFELYRNGKLVLRSPESRDLKERIEAVMGHFDPYTPLERQSDQMCLAGLLFEPSLESTVNAPEFFIFVNKRQVMNPGIVRTVREAYAMTRARATNLGAVLFLEFPEKFVDYNVHPQKKEVRFKNEFLVKKLIETAVSEAVSANVDRWRTDFAPRPQKFYISEAPQRVFLSFRKPETIAATLQIGEAVAGIECAPWDSTPEKVSGEVTLGNEDRAASRGSATQVFELTCEQGLTGLSTQPDITAMWRFIGTFNEHRFAIFESNSGLIFVDLAAAQRCILFDRLIHHSEGTTSQLLLMPKTVLVDPERSEIIATLLPVLASLGIEIEPFGQNIYKITALPRGVSEAMIVYWLQEGALEQQLTPEILVRQICAYLSVSPCTDEEIPALVRELLRCSQFLIAPNGSSVLFEIDRCAIAKKFGLQSRDKAYCSKA